MKFSDFCKVLDVSESYYTQEDLYVAYMRKMNQFASDAIKGSSFVMYPDKLRSEIWYYNVAYLSLAQRREILTEQFEREKYQKLLNLHTDRHPSYFEKVFILLLLYIIALFVIEAFSWLWDGLCYLWNNTQWWT